MNSRVNVSVLILLGSICLLSITALPASAVILDLTTPGADGWIGPAYFLQMEDQPTGSGVILPFVRIQATGEEHGFNTDYRPLEGDLEDVDNSPYTHSVLVGTLDPTEVDGVSMVPFILDINQEGSAPLISLDELQVYTAPVPNLGTLAAVQASNLIYDMGVGNKIYLDFSLDSGSGSGDMYFFLPSALLAGLDAEYLYLYSKFGATGGEYQSNDGYEEWAEIKNLPVSTEVNTWGQVKVLYR